MTATDIDYSDTETLRKLASFITDELWRLYPDADCTLDQRNEPWKLLVSGILSAQCTDARVNKITPELFERYPRVGDLADAQISELQEIIRSCGFFRVKSESIKMSMQKLFNEFEGEVPADFATLLSFPGVGRKIANLIMGDSFGIPGIVVDTHCARISRHFGLTDSTDPYRIEKDLSLIIPEERWTGYGHRVVAHGRAVCKARSPDCQACSLNVLCRKGKENVGTGK